MIRLTLEKSKPMLGTAIFGSAQSNLMVDLTSRLAVESNAAHFHQGVAGSR
jgi:hypothetical protein